MTAPSEAVVAGIDPGKTGALAIVFPDGSVQCLDVPRIKLKGKDKPAWSQWEQEWGDTLGLVGVDMVVIEDVSGGNQQGRQTGVTSAFNFGGTLRFAHALALSARPRPAVHFVTPSVWKGKLGLLNSDKGASREKCRNLYPRAVPLLTRVKDDGRAEAVLLAHYGRKYLC